MSRRRVRSHSGRIPRRSEHRMTTVMADQRVLSDELLQSFGQRAPTYDRENRFFTEDFEDLRLAAYLELAIPPELERLYRDVRCGGFHPANSALVHEIGGKTTLGILGEEPRWYFSRRTGS